VKELKLKEPDLKFLTEGLEKLKIPALNFEDYKFPDLSFLDQIKSIEIPDLSYLDKFKPINLSDLSFLEKVKPIEVSKIKIPKLPPNKKKS
jgi:hypothetical protein